MRRLAIQLAAVAAALGFATFAHADAVRLLPAAEVQRSQVLLQDVAELEGDAAQSLAKHVVLQLSEQGNGGTLALRELERALTEAGADWSQVRLVGASQCKVVRLKQEKHAESADARAAASPVAAVSNPVSDVDLTSAATLQDRLLADLAQLAEFPVSEMRVKFAGVDAAVLAQPAMTDRLEVEPLGRRLPGRISLTVRRYKASQLVATHRIVADVTRLCQAVVVKKSLSRGQTVTAGDVELREVTLTNSKVTPLTELKDVVGLTTTLSLAPETVVSPEHLRSPLLVRKGDLVTVQCIVGQVVVRAVARSLDEGALGDSIQLRNEATKQTLEARVTGLKQATAGEGAAMLAEGSAR